MAYLGGGSSTLTSLQALREASQRPWNPSAPMLGGTVTTGELSSQDWQPPGRSQDFAIWISLKCLFR